MAGLATGNFIGRPRDSGRRVVTIEVVNRINVCKKG